jgi:pyrroloquinoline quinone biosynthesis protein B
MRIIVLGAAAGGGFPQWNCNCAGCRRARQNEAAVRPRTQASVAVSADGVRWVLLNASPDLPYQLRQSPMLHPEGAAIRHSPLSAVIISSGDVDCLAGLLSLRESQAFSLYAGAAVHDILESNQIFRVLNRELVKFLPLATGGAAELRDASGAALGLEATMFAVPGKIPLYQETSDDIRQLSSPDAVIGLTIRDAAGKKMVYIPGCAAVDDELRHRIQGADVLFFDGTLWEDDEMIRAGTGRKTGTRMGHMSISGPAGSMAALEGVAAGRKIFIHINNTNPVLCEDSAQAAAVRAAGWEIAHDGMELNL